MRKVFIDANIPMYAAGRNHEYRLPCQKIVQQIVDEKIEAFTSVEIFQEILYRFMSIKKSMLGIEIYNNFFDLMSGRILSLTEEDVARVTKLARRYPDVKPRDLFHVAVMLTNGIKTICTADRDFHKISEIKRWDPLDF